MTAEALLHAAILDALRDAGDFGGVINGVFEGPPVKATTPYAEIGELLSTDWSTKDLVGREMLSAVIVRDRAERPARVQALATAADDAVQAVPRDLSGWRIASLVLVRNRLINTAPGGWTAIVEHRVRMLNTGS